MSADADAVDGVELLMRVSRAASRIAIDFTLWCSEQKR